MLASRCCTSCLPKMNLCIPYFLSSLCLAAAARHQGRLSALVEDLPPHYNRYGRLKELERLEEFPQETAPKNFTGERLELFEKLQVARSLAWPVLLRQDFTEGLKMFRKLVKEDMIQVRAAAAESPAWPILLEQDSTEGLRLFRTLVEEPHSHVRAQVAQLGPWETLLKQNFGEGLQMFRNLVEDKSEQVRRGAAQSLAWPTVLDQKLEEGFEMFRDLLEDNESWQAALSEPAWPTLLKRNPQEGFNMFHELLQDRAWQVRRAAALSSAWPTLLEQNLEEGLNMFRTLADTQSLALRQNVSYAWVHRAREAAESSPAWGALREPGVAEKLKNLGVQQLVGIAKDLQVIADNGYNIVKSLPLTISLVNTTQRVTNESLLADLADCPITHAHRRLAELASESAREAIKALEESDRQKREAVEQREIAHTAREESDRQKKEAEVRTKQVGLLLLLVLVLVTVACGVFLLWWFWPAVSKWREEKQLAEEAKKSIKEAEVYTMVLSVTPEPPAHLPIFEKYHRVYANPYVLHKYGYLQKVLQQAFHISDMALKEGLKKWDFASMKSSEGPQQKMASTNYGMARRFIDENQAADLKVLMQLCDEVQGGCDKYASKIEAAQDTAVQKCVAMYQQAFLAKRAYFDPLLTQIGKDSHAEAHLCGEKGMLRLAEKNALRPTSGLIWDCVRAMLVGHSTSELIQVLKALKEEQTAKRIKIIQINNRFKRPTADNWQDIAVYIMFTDTRFDDVVAEIQLVHETFVAVRTRFRAHDAYDNIRFAAEALKLKEKEIVCGLPDSQRPEK